MGTDLVKFFDPSKGQQNLSHEHYIFGRYWLSLMREGKLPSRKDIDFHEIRQTLSSLILLDVIETAGGSSFHYRYRLVGASNEAACCACLSGTFVHKNKCLACRTIHGLMAENVRVLRKPVYSNTVFCDPEKPHLVASRTAFPLSDDGVKVSRVVGIQTFSFAADKGAGQGSAKVGKHEKPEEAILVLAEPGLPVRLDGLF